MAAATPQGDLLLSSSDIDALHAALEIPRQELVARLGEREDGLAKFTYVLLFVLQASLPRYICYS